MGYFTQSRVSLQPPEEHTGSGKNEVATSSAFSSYLITDSPFPVSAKALAALLCHAGLSTYQQVAPLQCEVQKGRTATPIALIRLG